MSTRRRILQVLATTAAVWGLGAQAQSGKPQEALQLLRIGYQKASVNLVLAKQWGALEKRFPQAKVQWIEFPAGPQLLEALAAGSLELGLTGDSPPVFAQAAGRDLLYVGVEPPKPDSSGILVLPDSPLKSLADLKGRRIVLQNFPLLPRKLRDSLPGRIGTGSFGEVVANSYLPKVSQS